MLTPLRNAYYLSLPIVFGAVLSSRMATRLSDVTPVHWATPIVLALAVFSIYTLDHLLDIQKPSYSQTPRHQFHSQYEAVLWQVLLAVAVIGFVWAFFLPKSVVKFGIVLGGVCAAYVAAVYRLPERHPALLLKEPLVAILYSLGIWGSVWVQREETSGIEIAQFFMFLGIAFQNLLLFSIMENQERPQRPTFSLATELGHERSDTILRWLTFLVIGTGLTLCFLTDDRFAQRSAIMLIIMSLTLYGIQRYPDYFLRHERYRWLGDAVFWFPALVL